MKPIEIKVRPGGGREYPIRIGAGLLDKIAGETGAVPGACRALLVTDSVVNELYAGRVRRKLSAAGIKTHLEVIPAGEKHKNFKTYKKLIDRLAELDDARDVVVVALGGGVVGDLAGFAAATYRRGVPLVQVPTTLLASVDSSVGGKTGIDLQQGKNLVGAFYQPRAVVIDLGTLETLPARELRAGMAEVIKYGLIMDAPLAGLLEKDMDALYALERAKLGAVVARCCGLKAKVVARDERDTKDVRAILNFGHTFAHAVETACGYSRYRHGEAVAIGMVCAAELSARLGLLGARDAERVEALVLKAGLPATVKGAAPGQLFDLMRKDKKTRAGKLRFVLLDRIGHALVSDSVPAADVKAILKKRTG